MAAVKVIILPNLNFDLSHSYTGMESELAKRVYQKLVIHYVKQGFQAEERSPFVTVVSSSKLKLLVVYEDKTDMLLWRLCEATNALDVSPIRLALHSELLKTLPKWESSSKIMSLERDLLNEVCDGKVITTSSKYYLAMKAMAAYHHETWQPIVGAKRSIISSMFVPLLTSGI